MPEIYFACDVEADGPIPGPYSMLSLGISVVGSDRTFYSELKPISDQFVPEALAVCGLDREKLRREAPEPREAMERADAFVREVAADARPIFLAGPAVWDGMWIHWYFVKFLERNPFGVTGSGIDFRSYVMATESTTWNKSGKKLVEKLTGPVGLPHTHRADDDARELAAYFERIRARNEQLRRAREEANVKHAALEAELASARRELEKLRTKPSTRRNE